MIYAVLVVSSNGVCDYQRNEPSGQVAMYRSRRQADKAAEFLRDGLGDEVQSVNVVNYRQVVYRRAAQRRGK